MLGATRDGESNAYAHARDRRLLSLIATASAVAVATLLAAASAHDACFRTVPNWIPAGLVAVGAALRAAHGDLAWSAACAAAAFAVAVAMWRRGLMGGADAKLMLGAPLAAGYGHVLQMVGWTGIAGGLVSLAYIAGPFLVPRPAPGRPRGLPGRVLKAEMRRLRRRGPVPYACAIAAGTLCAMAQASAR